MNKEKIIHRKAESYVDAPQPRCRKCETPLVRAVEKNGICVHCESGIPRPVGRPPIGTETATHHVHIRTTAQRKSAWVRAARPRKLTAWIFEHLDKAAKYEPTEQD